MTMDLLEVAHERGKDANALKEAGRFLAALYMIGYVVEVNLKALIIAQGKRPPRSGGAGHDLRGLWELAGFRIHDVHAARRMFIEEWRTEFRYCSALPREIDFGALFQGAIGLCQYVQKQLRRRRGR